MENEPPKGNSQESPPAGDPESQAAQNMPKRWEDMNETERLAAIEKARALNEARDRRRRRGYR